MIETAALDWIVRQRDPDFDDWDGFTAWLEADPAHAEIYQAMAAADADMDALVEQAEPLALPVPANDVGRPSRRWAMGAVAAALVGVISIGIFYPRADPWSVETRPGERRQIALADGSRIILNGDTRVTLDRRDPRIATLERGEAMFVVHHDESDPFEVMAGEARLVDVGTAFNVRRDGAALDVAVSEGAVLYNPDAEAARIDAGTRLRVIAGADRYEFVPIDARDVGGWREGRLVYDGQALSVVAADLARYYGVRVAADAAVRGRPFRGVLTLPRREAMASLAPVLGVAISPRGDGWVLSSPQ
ncbi:MAG: FecR domain-containing protein [Sphingobium sp.]